MATLHLITTAEDPRCVPLRSLVEAMYAEEAAMGSPAVLAEGGGARWVKGVCAGLERFGRLVVAEDDEGNVVGFAHGAIRLQSEHLVGSAVGSITHVYVLPDHRHRGIARALVGSLGEWFGMRRVERTELTVVAGNAAAVAFWKAMGFDVSLLQMVRK